MNTLFKNKSNNFKNKFQFDHRKKESERIMNKYPDRIPCILERSGNNIPLVNKTKYLVPKDHLFFLGDNRDCSKDSRFLSEVGYVHKNNLVGKAQILFFSSDPFVGSIVKFWNWNEILRFKRFFKFIN